MQPLEPPDSHHLSAAQGWLELGNHVEANAELEEIAPSLRSHPAVLEIRWQIYAKEKRWEACVDIGEALVAAAPEFATGWIDRSFALHELKRTQEASDLLLPAVEKFPKVWLVRYNLACYACQLGKPDEAREWLKEAFDVADDPKAAKLLALEDPDLEAIWTDIKP